MGSDNRRPRHAGIRSWLPTLHGRLLAVMLSVLLCFSLAGGFILWSLFAVQRTHAETVDRTLEELVPVLHLEGEIRKVELAAWEAAFAIHEGAPPSVRSEFDAEADHVTADLAEYRSDERGIFSEESEQIAAAEAHWNAAMDGYEVALAGGYEDPFALAAVLGDVSAELDATVAELDLAQQSALEELKGAKAGTEQGKNLAAWVAVLSLVGSFFIVFGITRLLCGDVVGVIATMREGARRLASGDWGHRVEVTGPRELAELSQSFNAMSARLRQNHAELEHRAFHDQLTDLGNRNLIADRVERAAATRLTQGRVDAFLVVDLDRFKDLNDTRGHEAGDQVLVAAAQRILSCVRNADTVARLGGDGFGVLLEGLDSIDEAELVAERIVNRMPAPIDCAGAEVVLSASVGIVIASHVATSAELFSGADLAMYEAKKAGGSTWRVFDRGLRDELAERVALESDLRMAVKEDEIDVAYQVISDLGSSQPVGVEALARWTHPTLGPVAPGRFIPIAERIGLIADLGWNILRRSCTEVGGWRSRHPHLEHTTVAVNIGAAHLDQSDFVERVLGIVDDAGIEPQNLVIEVTETMMLQRDSESCRSLQQLRGRGVAVAVDDFGTGYSSLSSLRDYPADILKIDREFISGIDSNRDKRTLVRMIVELGRELRLRCVAEGIETAGEADAVHSTGCEFAQGFHFHRPSPGSDVEDLLGLGSSAGPVGVRPR